MANWLSICEGIPNLLRLRHPLRRFGANPIATIVTPRFLCNECLTVDREFAELGFTKPRKKFGAPRDLSAGDALNDATHASTAYTKILDLEGEEPVLWIAEVVHLHGG